MQKITPFLWFDGNAQEAIKFYTSIFKDSKTEEIQHLKVEGPAHTGDVVTGTFTLAGQQFMALDGGPAFKFNEAISLFITVEDQEELDYYWNKLIEGGGKPSQCGWLKDKFGLSWQVVPKVLGKYLGDKDPVKAKRSMNAMLKMSKIVIADLEKAHEGK